MTEFLLDVSVEDGKYTVRCDPDGELYALRYGEEWRNLSGDKLMHALASEIARLRALLEPQPITLPAPPDKSCFICQQRMIIPYARAWPGGGWHFEWDCPERCDPGLGILFFLPTDAHAQDELERAGFMIIEGETT